MDVKKIVNLTPEQYQELLETGQVEVDGKIKTKEDGVIYDTGYLEFIEWHNKFMQAQYEQVKVNHTPMAMKSLEQEYEELTAEDGGKESVHISAVGFTAILKSGDTIRITAPNGGNFYINGERLTHDYTFTGEGCEVVNVWVFEGTYGNQSGSMFDNPIGPPTLNDTPTFAITELDVRNKAQTPVVGDSYKNYALIIKAYSFMVEGLATRKLVSNGSTTYNQKTISSVIEEIECDCDVYNPTTANSIPSHKTLKKACFPNLTTINSKTGTLIFLSGCDNSELVIYYPNLQVINDCNHYDFAPFKGVANVTLPPSVSYVGKYTFANNKTITLECNTATFNTSWCGIAPSVNFTMCDDWWPNINIAVAARSRTKDWFIDLFVNKLARHRGEEDLGDGGILLDFGEITIPQAMLDALMEDEEGQAALQTAEDKNWIVGGA